MLTTNEVAQVFDTILSSPGMSETVKIDMRVSRRNILLLHHVIEKGLSAKDAEGGFPILANTDEGTVQELKSFSRDCLDKAGLVELSEKLMQLSLQNKKQ